MAILESYNLTNTQRDVFEAFEDLRVKVPTWLNLIRIGQKPTNTKHEWLERSLSETSTTVATAPSPATSGTNIVLAAASGIELYDLLIFASATGEERSEVVQVTNIGSAPTYTISRTYGSSTVESGIVAGDIVYIIKPQKQGKKVADYTTVTGTAPTANYNYTHIIDRTVTISRTASQVLTYGVVGGNRSELIDDQIAQQSLSMIYEMARIGIHNYRVAPSNLTTARGTVGGLKQFLAGGVESTTGGLIAVDHFNDVMQTLFENGANPGTQYLALCHPTQARLISALNTSGTNPVVMLTQDTSLAGQQAVTAIKGDLPGIVTNIRVDNSIPSDVIYLINPSLIEINYMLPYTILDATAEGDDAITKILKAEFTFTIKNGTTAHAKISGLSLS